MTSYYFVEWSDDNPPPISAYHLNRIEAGISSNREHTQTVGANPHQVSLNLLTNVSLGSVSTNDVLTYKDGYWKNLQPPIHYSSDESYLIANKPLTIGGINPTYQLNVSGDIYISGLTASYILEGHKQDGYIGGLIWKHQGTNKFGILYNTSSQNFVFYDYNNGMIRMLFDISGNLYTYGNIYAPGYTISGANIYATLITATSGLTDIWYSTSEPPDHHYTWYYSQSGNLEVRVWDDSISQWKTVADLTLDHVDDFSFAKGAVTTTTGQPGFLCYNTVEKKLMMNVTTVPISGETYTPYIRPIAVTTLNDYVFVLAEEDEDGLGGIFRYSSNLGDYKHLNVLFQDITSISNYLYGVWIKASDNSRLIELNTNLTVEGYINLNYSLYSITHDGTDLFIGGRKDATDEGYIGHYTTSLAYKNETTISGSKLFRGLYVDDEYIWAYDSELIKLFKIGKSDLGVSGSVSLSESCSSRIIGDDSYVYLASTESGKIFRITKSDLSISTFTYDNRGRGYSLYYDGDKILAPDYDNASIWVFTPSSLSLIDEYPVHGGQYPGSPALIDVIGSYYFIPIISGHSLIKTPKPFTTTNTWINISDITKHHPDTIIKYSDTAPSEVYEGMLWYDTANGYLMRREGTSWVLVGTRNKVTYSSTSAPPSSYSGTPGDIWIFTSTDPAQHFVWDGSEWKKTSFSDFSEMLGQVEGSQIADNSIDTAHIIDGAIVTDKLAAGAVTATKIAANSITSNHIQAGAVLANHIAADNIYSTHISSNSIATEHLQANAITSEKIEDGAITTIKIQDGAITVTKIQDGAVTETKITDSAITSSKIAADAILSTHISSNAIESQHIQADAILSSHISSNSITSSHIQSDAILSNHISANSILSSHISSNSITSAHIQADAITADKLATGSVTADAVSSNTIITDSANIANAIIDTAHIKDGAISNAKIGDYISSSDFQSGVKGWKIDKTGIAEFHNVFIRGELHATVFKKDEISATNGTLIVAPASILASGMSTSDTDMYVRDNVFSAGDYVMLKTSSTKQEKMLIDSYVGSVTIDDKTAYKYTVSRAQDGTTAQEWNKGDAVVKVHNRIVITSDLNYAPYIDVITSTGLSSSDETKVRVGNLEGITDSDFGALSGYGLYGENVYLKGKILIASGSSGITNLDDAGALASKDTVNLDTDVEDGSTYKRTTADEKTGANRAFQSIDSDLYWKNVIAGAKIVSGTPISGLNITADYMGYYNGSNWTVYIEKTGKYVFSGNSNHYIVWDGNTLAIKGNLHILSDGTIDGIPASNISGWAYSGDSTYINGGQIYTGTITANQIAAGAIINEKIQDGAVTSVKIQDGSITVSKIQDGAVTETKISDNAITTSKIAANAITSDKISANSILSSHISSNSITSSHIQTDAIISSHISSNSITSSHIQSDAITSTHISSNSITSSHIAANAVQAGHISSNSIYSTHISSNSITADKLIIKNITNTITNPQFEGGSSQDWDGSGFSVVELTDAPTKYVAKLAGTNAKAWITYYIPVTPSEQYILTYNSYSDPSNTEIKPELFIYDKDKNNFTVLFGEAVAGGSWDMHSDIFTIPPSGAYVKLRFSIGSTPTGTESVYFTNVTFRKAVESVMIVDGAVMASHISSNSITSSHIQADSIESQHIKSSAVTSTHISSNSITSDHISANSILSSHISSNAITSSHIQANAIESTHIKAGEVHTSHLRLDRTTVPSPLEEGMLWWHTADATFPSGAILFQYSGNTYDIGSGTAVIHNFADNTNQFLSDENTLVTIKGKQYHYSTVFQVSSNREYVIYRESIVPSTYNASGQVLADTWRRFISHITDSSKAAYGYVVERIDLQSRAATNFIAVFDIYCAQYGSASDPVPDDIYGIRINLARAPPSSNAYGFYVKPDYIEFEPATSYAFYAASGANLDYGFYTEDGVNSRFWDVTVANVLKPKCLSDTGTSKIDVETDIIPTTHNTYDLGSSTLKWRGVFTVNIYTGDLTFEERYCPLCHKEFKKDDYIVLKTISEKETRTVPVHLLCALKDINAI